MDLVPKRKSLLAATTAVLRDAIAAGEWSGELPGERKLCERMQVGRDTLRLALKQLEREGVIGRGDPGRRRPILKQSKRQSGSGRGAGKIGSIAYLTPHALERLTETSLAEVDVLRAQLADSGFRLEIVNSPAFGMKRPASSLKKLVNDSKVDAWILHQTTQPMQRWFVENAVPCLLHGLPHEDIELPFVDLDYVAIGRHAGGFLTGRGHRRIALLRPGARLRGLEFAESGVRDALASSRDSEIEPLIVLRETGSAGGALPQIDRLLGMRNPPTALIVTRSRQILTALTRFGQVGHKVPGDISLISLDYNPYLDHVLPQPACYKVDVIHAARMLVRKALELAGSGSTTRSAQALMPDFFPGDSVAKL